MEFLFMVLINIFLAAVIYLVISLKLEKSASEFHEKKLRKEMDDILREFNAAAERNITLLERKIQTARRVLEQAGELPHVDVRLGEEEFEKRHNEEIAEEPVPEPAATMEPASPSSHERKKGLPLLFNEFKSRIHALVTERKVFARQASAASSEKEPVSGGDPGGHENPVKGEGDTPRPGGIDIRIDEPAGPSIEKDAVSLSTYKGFSRPGKQETLSEADRADFDKEDQTGVSSGKDENENLQDLFRESSDVYSLACELYRRGHPVEELARYSGLSVGEISLVVNLHGEQ
jgi:hypothetical protein